MITGSVGVYYRNKPPPPRADYRIKRCEAAPADRLLLCCFYKLVLEAPVNHSAFIFVPV